ncbi:MAG: peptidylprolyl isomerase [Granulosicoccus sp.]
MIDCKKPVRPLLLCCILSMLFWQSAVAQDVVLDRIRAVVNEGVILDSDIAAATEFYKKQAQSNRQALPPDNVLAERVLEQLIDEEIRRQHARKLGVAVDPGSVNRAVEQIARNNNMDSLQFRQTIQQQGFNYNQFRQNIEQELLFQRLIERDVQARIRVSAQEIDDYVDSVKNDVEDQRRYRIQHILLAVPPSASAQDNEAAQARAQAILQRLNNGDDFSEVAAAESDGARALKGGDLGWRTLQEVPAFLAAALRGMNPGDLSEPLKSSNGLHIIKLTDRQSGDQTQQAETLARHIFIAGDDANIESRLNGVRERIQSGESFKAIAAEVSEDPNSASNSGELPWFSQGQMPPAMEEMADTLALNELSRPFRTQFGWHLLQILERRTTSIDGDALRQQASNALRQRKVEQETERWSRQLRDESFVEIRS